jgi:hypothetical protein
MKSVDFSMFLLVALLMSASMLVASQPCVLTQVDNNLFAAGQIEVSAMVAPGGFCPQVAFEKGDFAYPVVYGLSRLNDNGQWISVGIPVFATLKESAKRKRIKVFEGLEDGRYVLVSVNATADNPQQYTFLEQVFFTVGSTRENDQFGRTVTPQGFAQLPYGKSSRILIGSYLYFRGLIGKGAFATEGYLYQLQTTRTKVVPVAFEQVNPQDDSVIMNQSFLRGGTLDLPWVRVRLSESDFDLSRPIFGSITVDGGGVTTQGMVFDPTDPLAEIAPTTR